MHLIHGTWSVIYINYSVRYADDNQLGRYDHNYFREISVFIVQRNSRPRLPCTKRRVLDQDFSRKNAEKCQ